MTRKELELHLGEHVEVTPFDDFAYRGILRKTEEKIERYVKRFYYFCEGEQDNTIFRCSHVWTDDDVWEFIKTYNIPYCSLYDEGYTRLGCIGCPMASRQKEELSKYPKIRQAYLHAFKRMIEARKKEGLQTEWKTAEEVMEWWMNGEQKGCNDDTQI